MREEGGRGGGMVKDSAGKGVLFAACQSWRMLVLCGVWWDLES